MTPLERRSLVRSDGRHTDTLLLSRLDRADSTSSLPLATDRDRPKTANVQLRTTEVNLKIRHDLNKRVCVCVVPVIVGRDLELTRPLPLSLGSDRFVSLRNSCFLES